VTEAYFDDEGRLTQWPSRKRREHQRAVLRRLAERFETGRPYSEMEVNAVLKAAHTFGDHALLRRELYEEGLLRRTNDGARYWREGVADAPEATDGL
jgi:hypothetical protein